MRLVVAVVGKARNLVGQCPGGERQLHRGTFGQLGRETERAADQERQIAVLVARSLEKVGELRRIERSAFDITCHGLRPIGNFVR